jgi:hydroxymethylglutaryl-CoA synthase
MQKNNDQKRIGILGCSVFIPKNRIKTEDIAIAYGKDKNSIQELGVTEKTFAGIEDDTLTIAYNSTESAISDIKLREIDFKSEDLGAIFVGSETHVYAVKPTSSLLARFIGCDNLYHTADIEFACKAGTAAIQIVYNMIKSGSINSGLAVGADVAKGAPADALEYTAACGSASFILADSDKYNCIANIVDTISYSSDMPDFWRNEGSLYPEHAGRFSGSAYAKTVSKCIALILEKNNMKIEEFDHVVLHMPNAKIPKVVATKIGITNEQLKAGFIVEYVGNTYAACTPMGLTAVLEKAKPGQKILLCSYGSGSGSDAFIIETTEHIKDFNPIKSFESQLKNKNYASYAEYKLTELNKYE